MSSLHLCCRAGKQESGGHGDTGSKGCSAEPLDLLSSSYKVASGKWKSSQALVVFPISFPFKMTTASLSPQEDLESPSLSSPQSNGRTSWRGLNFLRDGGAPASSLCTGQPGRPHVRVCAGYRKLVIELRTLHSPSRPVVTKMTVPQCISLLLGPLSAML